MVRLPSASSTNMLSRHESAALALALAPVDMADPTWFPFDVDVVGERLQWLRLTEDLIEANAFLDPRMQAIELQQALTPLAPIAPLVPPEGAPAWLWHTSFCGSTLLARLLHVVPYTAVLREPLVLRRLSDCADAGHDIRPWVKPLVALLSRPWRPHGHVVVKPTHAALNIAAGMMAATPASRAIILTSTLEDFLVSHLKKTRETLAKAPLLARRALAAGDLAARLEPQALQPPSLLAAAALQWSAQRELLAEVCLSSGSRVRVLDWAQLAANVEEETVACASFLRLDLPEVALREHVRAHAGRHAKATKRPYDVALRQMEHDALLARHRMAVTDALRWAESHVLSVLRPQAVSLGR